MLFASGDPASPRTAQWYGKKEGEGGAEGSTLRSNYLVLEVVTHVLGTFRYLSLRPDKKAGGGAGGIRTLDRALQPYNGLANRRLQPLGHSSMRADMPDAAASRKRQIQITPRPFRGAGAFRIRLVNGRYPLLPV